jgi:predicted membrane-bound mannosyltransferase
MLAVIAGGLVVYLVYFAQTRYDVRNFDAGAHLAYVEYVATHHALPSATECSVCHHPPAYYLLAAPIDAALRSASLDATRGLQIFSLVLWLGFIAFAALAIERLVDRVWQRALALALVVFWPYSVIQSVRVNNDTLVDLCAAATIYFTVRWSADRRARWLGAAAGSVALGLATKASALVLVVAVVAVVALVVARAVDRKAVVRGAALPLLGLVAAVTIFVAARARAERGAIDDVLGDATRYTAPRAPAFYVTFSPGAMLSRPWARVTMSRTTEPTYANHLLKSSLYGAQTGSRVAPGAVAPSSTLALVENGLVMLLASLLVAGVALGRRDPSGRRMLAGLLAVVFFAGGVAFHLLAPNDQHADFRFILPIVIPLAVLYAWASEGLRERKLSHVGALVAAIFLGVAIVSFAHMKPDTTSPMLTPLFTR